MSKISKEETKTPIPFAKNIADVCSIIKNPVTAEAPSIPIIQNK
jgi:hypothetical protein